MMSFRAACELAHLVAAVAPVERAQNAKMQPNVPVSVIIFHGTADRLVPIEGSSTPFQVGPHRTDTSAADTIAFWVGKDSCSAAPRHEDTRTAPGSRSIQGGRHIWPGVPMSDNQVPATEIM